MRPRSLLAPLVAITTMLAACQSPGVDDEEAIDQAATAPGEADFAKALSSVVQEYLARGKSIQFPQPGRPVDVDKVDPRYWTIRDIATETLWQLRAGVTPSTAVSHAVLVAPENYETDCRKARQIFDLMALLRMEMTKHGKVAGELLFNARFAGPPTGNYAKALKWVKGPRTSPPPSFEYILDVSKSGAQNSITMIETLWKYPLTNVGVPGDAGYYPNHAVKPSRMAAGWAGENFVVFTDKRGSEMLFGHGLGEMPEAKLKAIVAEGAITKMPDFLEYFDTTYPNQPKDVTAANGAQVNSWLRQGPLSSREAFAAWLESPAFETWHRTTFGSAYAGERTLAGMPANKLQAIVEAAIPGTKGLLTAYAAINGRAEGQVNTVAQQMALLLKNGKLEQGAPTFEHRAPADPLNAAPSLYDHR